MSPEKGMPSSATRSQLPATLDDNHDNFNKCEDAKIKKWIEAESCPQQRSSNFFLKVWKNALKRRKRRQKTQQRNQVQNQLVSASTPYGKPGLVGEPKEIEIKTSFVLVEKGEEKPPKTSKLSHDGTVMEAISESKYEVETNAQDLEIAEGNSDTPRT